MVADIIKLKRDVVKSSLLRPLFGSLINVCFV